MADTNPPLSPAPAPSPASTSVTWAGAASEFAKQLKHVKNPLVQAVVWGYAIVVSGLVWIVVHVNLPVTHLGLILIFFLLLLGWGMMVVQGAHVKIARMELEAGRFRRRRR